MLSEKLTLHGDLLDQKRLAQVLDELDALGVVTKLRRFRVGERATDPSLAELTIQAEDRDVLVEACRRAGGLGATFDETEAELAAADTDGVLPEGFHSTTNFPTYVLHAGTAIPVEAIEMDCGIRVWDDGGTWRAETCPMHKARAGDQFVVGYAGVRVELDDEPDVDGVDFGFMSNDVSTERPKRRMIADAAQAIRRARDAGRDVVLVGGPAIVHSGSAPLLAKLIADGWVTVLLAGNALAAHDIEANMLGTSLGVDLDSGRSGPHGHTHHLRAINRVRRAGSIKAAVDSGELTSGIMHTCVVNDVPFVLCGSIRDDGPLPDVIPNVLDATDAMRAVVGDADVCLMVATMLHSVAVGNILPARVSTFCVDTDADTVIKLTDRGTHQAIGIVTDCEYFLGELCSQLDA
ncbi:MAG: TIGR00300 family protein [Ilumatobacter sp.]|nr:TIGR00300 family protein [Ilumatobacter sp.]